MTYPNDGPSQAGGDDTETRRIETEIEDTRHEMSATIDQIGHRLQPASIADEARQKVREATVGKVERMVDGAGQTAQQAGTTLVETIRQNPVPAAMAAMGIGWLVVRMRDSGQARSDQWRYDSSGRSYGRYGEYGGGDGRGYGNGGSGQDPLLRARSAAEQATSSAQQLAGQAIDDAQQAGADIQRNIQHAAGSAVDATQDKVQQAQWQFDRTLSQNPLALGALAIGVGAAVGLALPETQKERELYAEPREQLVSKVSETASQALEQAEAGAEELGEQLRSEG
jgi:DNA segregation ATPase FtsK/SpoIIIE-like protein